MIEFCFSDHVVNYEFLGRRINWIPFHEKRFSSHMLTNLCVKELIYDYYKNQKLGNNSYHCKTKGTKRSIHSDDF